MAKSVIKAPRRVVERNIELLDKLMRYLLAEPQIFTFLPDKFELVILPEDDPEIRLYNLELLDRLGTENKPVVFARLASSTRTNFKRSKPHLYVPIAA
jgi:hypothetical protein